MPPIIDNLPTADNGKIAEAAHAAASIASADAYATAYDATAAALRNASACLHGPNNTPPRPDPSRRPDPHHARTATDPAPFAWQLAQRVMSNTGWFVFGAQNFRNRLCEAFGEMVENDPGLIVDIIAAAECPHDNNATKALAKLSEALLAVAKGLVMAGAQPGPVNVAEIERADRAYREEPERWDFIDQ